MSLHPCIECGHRVSAKARACPECGQPRPVRLRSSGRRALGLLLLMPVLLAGSVAAGAAVRWYVESRPAEPPAPLEPITAAEAPTTFPRLDVELARSDGRVVVTNVGDQPWTGCTVDVNAGVPGGAFSGSLGSMRPGARVSLPLGTFARADGRTFDPNAERVQVVDLHCDTPNGPAHFSGGP